MVFNSGCLLSKNATYKMMLMRTLLKYPIIIMIVTLIVVMVSSPLVAQGPWSPGKGHGYAQLLYNTVPAYTTIFAGDQGNRALERQLTETDVILYSEFGISQKLTLGTTIPLISVSSGIANPQLESEPTLPAGDLTSLGNISLQGKYNLLNKTWNVSFITQLDLPTSSRTLESGLSTGVDAFTFQPKISAGKSSVNGFFYGFLGYGIRTNNHNDFVNFGVEAGFNAGEKFSLIINVNRWQNLDNGDPSVDSPQNIITGFYTSFQEYTGYLLKLFFKDIYKGFGGFASLGGGGGANSVASSPALSLGVFYKW